MQLYGSAAEYCMNKYKGERKPLLHLGKDVLPILMTTADVSNTATQFAKYLGIRCMSVPFETGGYPQIKCNVGNNGEKIYHLPFDQQYDNVKVEQEKGECLAFTIKEAEELGFRHAMKWQAED